MSKKSEMSDEITEKMLKEIFSESRHKERIEKVNEYLIFSQAVEIMSRVKNKEEN